MLTVVTGWNPAGFEEYGHLFIKAWAKYWDPEVRLISYVEQFNKPIAPVRHVQVHLANVPANTCREIYDNPTCRGMEPTPAWKAKEIQNGYSYRFDAFKFYKQGIIPHHAAYGLEGFLLWLDGDVETVAPVNERWITSLLPFGQDVAYLGREGKHSEIGFQLYRLPQALPMLAEFSRLYSTGEILRHREWHSAYAFDLARVACPEVRCFNLTPRGHGHVWMQSALRYVMNHHKGNRKADWARRSGRGR